MVTQTFPQTPHPAAFVVAMALNVVNTCIWVITALFICKQDGTQVPCFKSTPGTVNKL